MAVISELEARESVGVFLLRLEKVVYGPTNLGKHLLGASNGGDVVDADGGDRDARNCVASVDSMVRQETDEIVGDEFLVHVLAPEVSPA